MKPGRWIPFILVIVVLVAGSAIAGDSKTNADVYRALPLSCRIPEARCSLGETADEVGLFAGAAVTHDVSDPRMDAVPIHFNSITAENALKWGALSPTLGNYNFTRADALVDWAQDNDLRIRGHVLVWGKSPGHGHPDDLADLVEQARDPEAFVRNAIRDHIATVVGRYAGRIETWDVVNEPLSVIGRGFEKNVFYNAMGREYIAEAFRAARQADPNARLVLNEYFNAYNGQKAAFFLELLEDLIDEGVPIDGVGIQAHVYFYAPHTDHLADFMAAIDALGLEVELTEVDIAKTAIIGPLLLGQELFEVQAELYATLADACTTTPLCRGLTVWGIDDGHTWLDRTFPFEFFAPHDPLLLDRDLDSKPAYFAVMESFAGRE